MGQSQPEAPLTRSILSISKEIDERLQSLQSNRYLKRWDDKFHLCNSFRTWMKQAKALDPSSSGIDFLVRDSSELKGMITESLNVINNHLSLLPRPPSSDEPDRSRSRSSKRKRPRTQSPERLDPEQSTPNEGLSPRSRAWDVASVVSTALSSTESAIMLASDPLRLSQKMIERSLTWLSPMTNLSRKLAIEKRFPELCEHFDYSGNEMTFDIYPRALETVNKLAYKASHELRVKLAIAASLRVSELIRDKNMADLESNEPYHAGQRTEVEDTSNLNINWHSPAENIPAIRLSPPEPNLKGVGRHMDPTSPKPQSPAPRKDKFNSKADSQWLICIVDGCEKPFTNYNSITAWLKHLDTKHPRNRNAPTWICTDQSHGPDIQRFEELILFQNHMWKEHQDTFEPSELPELAEVCKEYVAPTGIFDICPFCGYQNRYRGHSSTLKPERPQLNHIIQHFDELSAEFLKWVTEYEPSIRSVDPRERWLDPKVSQTAKGNLWVSTFSEYDGMRGYAGEAFWDA